jgi:uncharacterized protein (TIGR02271 family)
MKTVVALFDSFDEGRSVIDELSRIGIARNSIKIANESKGEFAFETGDEFDTNDSGMALINGLSHGGVPRTDAEMYAEGVRRGGTLLVCTLPDDQAQRAYDLMKRHGSVDINQRCEMWKKSGWTGYGTGTDLNLKSGARMTGEKLTTAGKEVVPVIEEELRVGKREVEKGGVRVESHVIEKPVTEQVHLREEHVRVERRPVDRPVSDADVANLRDRTIELHEKAEEVVISKRPRVIEEVIIGKEVSGHTETVRDTVKRTDVKVEKLAGERLTSSVRFEDLDTDFRTHYRGLNLKDTTYDHYMPVYKFGYSLGTDDRFRTGEWSTIEPEARRHWETRNPGTWEQFKDSIRYAWDRVRSR